MIIKENDFMVKIAEQEILPFEEKVLASGLCDFSLPMRFATSKGEKNIFYECSGYTALRDLNINTMKFTYEILEKTLITLSKAEEFLIDLNKATLSLDTVFYHLKYKDIKIAYLPAAKKKGVFLKIIDFIDSLGENADGQTRDYLHKTRETICMNNYNIKDAINYIGEIKREIFLCGIKT